MATLEQLQRAYEIARRDGDTEDIQVLEAALRQASGAQRSEGTSSEDIRRRYLESLKGTSDFRYSRPGFLENIGAGFGAGAVGTGLGGGNTSNSYLDTVNKGLPASIQYGTD